MFCQLPPEKVVIACSSERNDGIIDAIVIGVTIKASTPSSTSYLARTQNDDLVGRLRLIDLTARFSA
jgi:hypothetical protein